MNKEDQNKPSQAGESSSKFSGALPFILIFGGITVAMILIKLLMNLLGLTNSSQYFKYNSGLSAQKPRILRGFCFTSSKDQHNCQL
jgi:hypothetical protein